MSHISNDEVLERVGELTDSDMLTKERTEFIADRVLVGDLEGLYFALPSIEQDVIDRVSESVRTV